MRPRERRDSGQNDLFKARLDQIVDLDHPLAKLGRVIDWRFLEGRFGAVYSDKAGHPPLPTRLMAGLSILKHMHDLSDEDLCARWVENPYYQLFCGEEFFQHKLTFDRSSLTRWRQRMGEEKLVALIQESLSVATRTGAAKPADFSKVIVDTTVQPKAVAFPTDAKLMHRARERLVKLAKKAGVELRQSYQRVGKHALIAHQRYAHAKQFKRANRALKSTHPGRTHDDAWGGFNGLWTVLRCGESCEAGLGVAARFPSPWRQFADALDGMIGRRRKDVGEPGARIDVVEAARLNQSVDRCCATAPFVGAREGPVAARRQPRNAEPAPRRCSTSKLFRRRGSA